MYQQILNKIIQFSQQFVSLPLPWSPNMIRSIVAIKFSKGDAYESACKTVVIISWSQIYTKIELFRSNDLSNHHYGSTAMDPPSPTIDNIHPRLINLASFEIKRVSERVDRWLRVKNDLIGFEILDWLNIRTTFFLTRMCLTCKRFWCVHTS